ncbi:MAG: hypothetical protein PW792_08585 [Acidobacteriaceae bacterium]|nr:hypothetical protein [Acidobacteriaceae bacterium]
MAELRYIEDFRRSALELFLKAIAAEEGIVVPSPDGGYRRALVAHFLQGARHVHSAIVEGAYAKSAAILKQDMELLCRIEEVKAGTEKEGQQPQFRAAPYLGRMNGHLNDLAHPSKEGLIHLSLEQTVADGKRGISPFPIYEPKFAKSHFSIHAYLCLQASREAIELLAEAKSETDTKVVELANEWKALHAHGLAQRVFLEE